MSEQNHHTSVSVIAIGCKSNSVPYVLFRCGAAAQFLAYFLNCVIWVQPYHTLPATCVEMCSRYVATAVTSLLPYTLHMVTEATTTFCASNLRTRVQEDNPTGSKTRGD